MSEKLDRRSHAYRQDLADIRLRDRVTAERYIEGMPAEVLVPVAALHPRPDAQSGIDTQALRGEALSVFDIAEGWAWVQLAADGYVGYVREETIGQGTGPATHVVSVPRSFVYPGADLRFPYLEALSMGSRLRVTGEAETRGTGYATLEDGSAVIAAHLRPVAETPDRRSRVGGIALYRNALSLGRTIGFRNRLLRPGADGACHDRQGFAAGFRPAGRRPGPGHRPDPGRPATRRSGVLERPCRLSRRSAHAAARLGRNHVCDPGTASRGHSSVSPALRIAYRLPQAVESRNHAQ
jgi:hypothetical protein